MTAVAEKLTTQESTNPASDFTLMRARQDFSEMEKWVMSPKALALPEHEIERGIERRSREVNRLLLQAHLQQRGTGHLGTHLKLVSPEGEGKTLTAAREDTCQVASLFGKVTVRRTAYTTKGEEALHPLDQKLQLPERSFSYEVQQRVVEEAVRGPFDEAVGSLSRYTGQTLSKLSVEQIVAEAGREVDDFYAARRARPGTEPVGKILVGSVDGKGVPMVKEGVAEHRVRRKKGEKANKKKMATVAAVFTQEPRIRTPESVLASLFDDSPVQKEPASRSHDKRVWASLSRPKEAVITELAEEMAVRDPRGKKTRVVVTDGERALQRLVMKQTGGVLLVLDFLHVLEYLWKSAHAFYREGSREAEHWVRKHALMVLRGEVSQVVKGMRQSATKRGLLGEKRKAIMTASAYFYRNRQRMRYRDYLAQGLPIASGVVEGACKNLVKDRMERSGMRWKLPGGEAMLKLRAVKLNGDLDEYWEYRIKREQQRLYGSYRWKILP